MSPEEKRKITNELALQKRDELQNKPTPVIDQSLMETREHIPPVERMSIRELVVKDGSIRIHCAICDLSWIVNVHEQTMVYTDELKCRRCMVRAGVATAAERPLTAIFVEATIGYEIKKELDDPTRY